MTSHKLQLYAAFTWYSSLPLRAHLFYLENTASVFVLFARIQGCISTQQCLSKERKDRTALIRSVGHFCIYVSIYVIMTYVRVG